MNKSLKYCFFRYNSITVYVKTFVKTSNVYENKKYFVLKKKLKYL